MVESRIFPRSFLWRRLHSITGFFLVLYLIEHLFVNSQAALLFGSDGIGFVEAVNSIHKLPFLPLIEIGLLGVPILLHGGLGVAYLMQSKINTFNDDGTKPYLPEYSRNQAYTWQRITSWILLFAIVAHVIHMRFMEYPAYARNGTEIEYMVRVRADDGLYTLAERLGFQIYTKEDIESLKSQYNNTPIDQNFSSNKEKLVQNQHLEQQKEWILALEKRPLSQGEVIAGSTHFGMAELLMVRETFKMPLMIALYTIFVLTACYHAFNGLWTFLITWGVTLTVRTQRLSLYFSVFMMCLIAFLGLTAIWGSYWINLKQ